METPILQTKLFIPLPRQQRVSRPRLIERLNEGLGHSRSIARKLNLISAPAGFGKTTLVSEWVTGCGRPAAWLSLDEGDNDTNRLLGYLVAALQTILDRQSSGDFGAGVLGLLAMAQAMALGILSTS